ncbi:MAG: sulfurtransferase TusA family protein [Alphaproteobacteria bacterium]|nr:MAG: sulfurtransferase TusA family protein [Alphaproteobacteria bacterium]
MTERRHLDATGLRCPLPVLRARKALQSVPPGGVLELLADDPAATKDVPAFCAETGYHLLSQEATAGGWRFVIEKPVR